MITTAVIVAAGFGSRLQDKTRTQPKGFLTIEGISLIERSVSNLIAAGIKDIVIGTGYLSEQYDEFARQYSQIRTIYSPNYAQSSSMETLYNMRNQLHEDFLLLESDLLYEPRALLYLLDAPDTVLASGTTHSNDEVYIETDDQGVLQQMSKDPNQLRRIDAELVGITAISQSAYQQMCIDYAAQTDRKIDYEYILVAIGDTHLFKVKKVDDLVWCEIDDAQHLARAKKLIYPKIKAKSMDIKRNILLNPGPATTTDTVKLAQVVPDICPREKEFGAVMAEVAQGLTAFVADPDTHTAVLFGGSGTAVVEAMLTSVVPPDRQVLIINNGSYGARMCQIAKRYQMDYVAYDSSPIEPIDLQALEQTIQTHERLSHIALVHNETTTGLLNDLEAIGALAKKYNLQLMLDAMSSYAALPISMVEQNIAYLAASSNKNIQGMAGVGFVIGSHQHLQGLAEVPARSFYLSLYEQYQNFKQNQQMRFTPPVQTLYALQQAIWETQAEGISKRYQRYSESWQLLTTELRQMGLSYLVDDAHHSRIITSIHMPAGVDFDAMHDYFYARGFTIYPGKVEEFNTFRIANIGAIDKTDMAKFIVLLKEYLAS